MMIIIRLCIVVIGTLFVVQTVLQTLIETVDQDSAANYALLMMWASLVNAVPVCNSIHTATMLSYAVMSVGGSVA